MNGIQSETSDLLPRVSSVRGEIGLYGHHKHGLTVLTTAVFAVGEMAGAGVLALPASMNGTGYSGIILNILCACVSAYTGTLLGKCWLITMDRYSEYQQHTRYPYPAMGMVTFGKPGRLLVSCSINLTLFGVSVVFLLLASQNMQNLVFHAGKDISFCYWLLIVAGVLLPITWLGTPKDFWPIGVAAVVATSIACVLILINTAHDSKELAAEFHPHLNFTDFFMAFGTICFAYGGHPAFPTFQTDMRKPEKFGLAIFIAYAIVLLMYLPVAVTGYYVYGVAAKSNILETMSSGPILYVVLSLITLHLFCSFIIVINPVCQECEELLNIPKTFSIRRVIFRTLMVAVVLFVAESVPEFGPILSLIGGSTTTLLAYILPPLFYLRLGSMKGDWEPMEVPLHIKVLCFEIMGLGLLAGVASTYSAIKGLADFATTPCFINADRPRSSIIVSNNDSSNADGLGSLVELSRTHQWKGPPDESFLMMKSPRVVTQSDVFPVEMIVEPTLYAINRPLA